jgi:protease I
MDLGLKGRHIAILASDGGDAAQLAQLRRGLIAAGAVADIVGVRSGPLRPQPGDTLVVERSVDSCHAADFDALVIPGGKAAIETLRAEPKAVHFVREFMAADKPVAAIADGVSMLVAADAAAGRTVAVGAESADDVRAAGAEVVDEAVHVDGKLVTARDGHDLDELTEAILREFANRVDEARIDQLSEQSFPASDPPPGPVAVGGEGASRAPHLDPRRSEDGDPGDQAVRP